MTDGLKIVKARLYVSEGQRYRPNDSPESRLFESFYNLYKGLHPDPNERVSKRGMVKDAIGENDSEEAVHNILYAVNDDMSPSKLIGYRVFTTVTMGPREEGAFGASWYTGVDPNERGHGYGSKLVNAATEEMRRIATSRGRTLHFVHAEIDDPERMTPEQIEKEKMLRMFMTL